MKSGRVQKSVLVLATSDSVSSWALAQHRMVPSVSRGVVHSGRGKETEAGVLLGVPFAFTEYNGTKMKKTQLKTKISN